MYNKWKSTPWSWSSAHSSQLVGLELNTLLHRKAFSFFSFWITFANDLQPLENFTFTAQWGVQIVIDPCSSSPCEFEIMNFSIGMSRLVLGLSHVHGGAK